MSSSGVTAYVDRRCSLMFNKDANKMSSPSVSPNRIESPQKTVSSSCGSDNEIDHFHGDGIAFIKGTSTVLEGAELVRTVAVSYATPILHRVLLRGTSPSNTSSVTTTTPSSTFPVEVVSSLSSQPLSAAPQPLLQDAFRVLEMQQKNLLKEELVNLEPRKKSDSSHKSSSCSIPTHISLPSMASVSSESCSSCSSSSSPLHPSSNSGFGVVGRPQQPNNSIKNDDELTSLSWLQDSNFILGTALSPIKTVTSSAEVSKNIETSHESPINKSISQKDIKKEIKKENFEDFQVKNETKIESPTSDLADDSLDFDEPGDLIISDDVQQASPVSKAEPVPYNPQFHVKAKPPFSFSCLIFMAIEESEAKALPVKDIYSWIIEHFPYYKNAPTGWKNSVRHNLSLNKCFCKVEKAPNLGKGSLWMVDPVHRPNLIQALSKAPLQPHTIVDRIYMLPNKTVLSSKSAYSKLKSSCAYPSKVIFPSCIPTSNLKSDSNSATFFYPAVNDDTSAKKINHCKVNNEKENNYHSTRPTLPNPELFPLLAKRMESGFKEDTNLDPLSTIEKDSPLSLITVEREDVDAATAMLALKHGSPLLTADNVSKRLKDVQRSRLSLGDPTHNKRKQRHNELSDPDMMVISSSARVDHEYFSSKKEKRTPIRQLISSKESISPSSSIDEAFSEESFESDSYNEHPLRGDPSGISEGADALLNLASIATSLASKRNLEETLQEVSHQEISCSPVLRIRTPPKKRLKEYLTADSDAITSSHSKERKVTVIKTSNFEDNNNDININNNYNRENSNIKIKSDNRKILKIKKVLKVIKANS